MSRRFVISAGVLVAVAVGATALGVRGAGITANRQAGALEERLARRAWRFLIPSHARDAANPVPLTAAVLGEARAHWADHCASCHGNDGTGSAPVGRHVFPPAPDMRAARTQNLTDGELFYAIEQGIPWTAMPAWANGTSEGAQESWALVHFIRHLPRLTPDEVKEMERFNPRSPADDQRERDIDDFLKGPSPEGPRKNTRALSHRRRSRRRGPGNARSASA
jgi:mono/diheme cytochrome c family protein